MLHHATNLARALLYCNKMREQKEAEIGYTKLVAVPMTGLVNPSWVVDKSAGCDCDELQDDNGGLGEVKAEQCSGPRPQCAWCTAISQNCSTPGFC